MASAQAARKRAARRFRGDSEAVALQLSIRASVPKGYRLTRELLDEAVREWAESGESPDGMEISVTSWKTLRRGKVVVPPGESDEARERFKEVLRQGRFTVSLRSN